MNVTDDDDDSRDPVDVLAEEFIERHRRGESPSVEEYAVGHPDLAEIIRDLFPSLLVMEEFAPSGTGSSRWPQAVGTPEIADYRILREVGRGGMGIVYEAEQISLGRRVALKVLPPNVATDETRLERFRLEARSAARLHHTNIVPIFDVGSEAGLHYYAMQFIRGQGLDQVLSEIKRLRRSVLDGPVESPRAEASEITKGVVAGRAAAAKASTITAVARLDSLDSGPRDGSTATFAGSDSSHGETRDVYHASVARIALQVADALDYAHGEGVLHRDIKPSNLLVDAKGTVWITDFGLAKSLEAGDLTQTGDIVGTLRYLAPERLDGWSDARTDVYSLGLTIYELLTLEPAFQGVDRGELIREITRRDPVSPRRVDPRIPRDLETIVLKAIAREPGSRYRSALELAADLRRFIERKPIHARRATWPERLWRWCQRNTAVAYLTAATAGLLVALAVVAVVAAIHLGKERNVARLAEEDAKDRLAEARLAEGQARLVSGTSGQRFRAQQAIRAAAERRPTLDVRNAFISTLSLVDSRVECEWDIEGAAAVDFAQQRIAIIKRIQTTIAPFGDAPSPIIDVPVSEGWPVQIAFSRDGRFLVEKRRIGDRAWLHAWDLDRLERVFDGETLPSGTSFEFPAQGGVFVHVTIDGEIVWRDLPSFEEMRRLEVGPDPLAFALSPDGARLAVSGQSRRSVEIWRVGTERRERSLYHPGTVSSVAWHPGRPVIATACHDFGVRLFDVDEGRLLHHLERHQAEVVWVSFQPTGGMLVSAAWDNRSILWDAQSGVALLETDGVAREFDAEGRRLEYRVGRYRAGIWSLHGADEYRVLRVDMSEKGPKHVTVSPDGEWIAANAATDGCFIWSRRDLDRPVRIGMEWVDDLRFAPRGAHLYVSGPGGTFRWSLRSPEATDETGRERWTIGPPERVCPERGRLGFDRAGRHLAVGTASQLARVLDLETGDVVREVDHSRVAAVSLSDDARWLATGTWQGIDTKVWDVASGTLVHSLRCESSIPVFRPGDQELWIGTGRAYHVLSTGDWRKVREILRSDTGDLPGGISFFDSGRLVAIAKTLTSVDILRSDTGEELARLSPAGTTYRQIEQFEPCADGSLLAAASGRNLIQLWDLALIRHELRSVDLDWEPAVESVRVATAAPPVELRVDLGPVAPRAPSRESQAAIDDRAIAHLSAIIEAGADGEGIRLERAMLLERRHLWIDAAADLDRVAVLRGGRELDLSFYAWRGRLRSRGKLYDSAIEDLDIARERIAAIESGGEDLPPTERLRPEESLDLGSVLRELAHAHDGLGTWSAARDALEEVVAIAPGDAWARERLAWISLVESTAARDAVWILEHARIGAELSPGYGSYRTLAAALCEAGHFEEALEAADRAERAHGGIASGDVQFCRAIALAGLDREDEARKFFERGDGWLRGALLLPGTRSEHEALRARAERALR